MKLQCAQEALANALSTVGRVVPSKSTLPVLTNLFTPGRFDGLPGFRFDCKEGRYVTRDQISEYLEQYAERFGLPVRLGIDVLGYA